MRIAEIAPLFESVPPGLYGGTERVVSYLTEELVALGHDVTLFAPADATTSAHLVPVCPRGLWRDADVRETLPHQLRMLELVFRDVEAFDVLHFHTDYIHFPLVRRHRCASATTLHGRVHAYDLAPLFDEYADVPLVSISNNQRTPLPDANWLATIYHGLPPDLFQFAVGDRDYLAFLGRMSPEKGVERAIAVATLTGIPLKIAGKIYPEEREYYQTVLEPMIRRAGPFVEMLGELSQAGRQELLGGALATLFPINWPEPFGLVMIESFACGTPVIAWRHGSVPEVVDDGVSGFVVDNVEQAVAAVEAVARLDRRACRQAFEERFTARRMALDYVDAFGRLSRDGKP